MASLPSLQLQGRDFHLPLSEATARRLISALLADGEAEKVSLLNGAIEADACFFLWAIGRSHMVESDQAESATSTARWLAPRLLAELSLTSDDEVELSSPLQVAEAIATPLARKVAASLQGSTEDTISKGDNANLNRLNQQDLQNLIGRLTRLQQLTQQYDNTLLHEKLASLKEFTYGASHEINNPLFNISSRAQLLLRDETDPERRKKLATIHSHAIRASEMIRTLALFAHPPKPEFTNCDITQIVSDVVAELSDQAATADCRLTCSTPGETISATADANQVAVCLRELLLNSIEAISRSGRAGEVKVKSQLVLDQRDSPQVRLEVSDDGPGLDSRASRHLFDPYFSGYEAGRGLGMGLPKCWQIMQAHAGEVQVESQSARGTCVTLQWPQAQPSCDAVNSTVSGMPN